MFLFLELFKKQRVQTKTKYDAGEKSFEHQNVHTNEHSSLRPLKQSFNRETGKIDFAIQRVLLSA